MATPNPNGKPFGVAWERLAPHWPLFRREGEKRGVDPTLLARFALVESGWNQAWPSGANAGKVIEVWDADKANGPSVGILQVKPKIWGYLLPGADAYTVEGNVAIAAELLRRKIAETGSWPAALTRFYHPGTSPNGTTPEHYVRCVEALGAEWAAKAKPEPTPVPDPPTPAPPTDPLLAITGGRPVTITYGWRHPTTLPFYDYFRGHGGTPNQHPGVDIPLPYGATVYSPIAGTVVCVATGKGPGTKGQGCAAYRDTGDAGPEGRDQGVGRVEIMADDGSTCLIFGHARTCLQPLGGKVKPGDPICTVGGMLAPHIHYEARVWREDGRCSLD